MDRTVSSRDARPGDRFTVTLQPGRNDGGLPEGTRFEATVRDVARSFEGRPGWLDAEFTRMLLPGGRSVSVRAVPVSMDRRALRQSSDGRLFAPDNRVEDRRKWTGIGAGAAAALSAITKGKVIEDTLLGAAGGYLFSEAVSPKPGDAVLRGGMEIGVRLERSLYFGRDDDRRSDDRRSDREDDYPLFRRDRDLDGRYADPEDRRDPSVRRNDRFDEDDRYIPVRYDDEEMRFEESCRPFRSQSVVYVPLEPMMRRARVDYRWDDRTRTVRVPSSELEAVCGSRVVYLRGRRHTLEGELRMRNGVVFVPTTFLELVSPCRTSFDDRRRSVIIVQRGRYDR
jgi:hypothetical protein